jgi:GNAT superfamily N-acetyltransferase
VAPPDRPQRPFVPHVTLSSRIGAPEIGCAVTVLSGYRRPVTFSRIHLLEQQPGLPGRPWRIVAGRLLGGSSVVGRGGHELELTVLDRLDPGLEDLVAGMWERHGRDAYGEDWHPDEPFAIVARAGGRVVGAATGRTSGPTCECERLIVDPVTRGEGVGTRLLRHVERLAVERGCTVVRICTEDGGPAERFFSERGFVRSTLLPGWRNGADFVVMVRDVPGRQAPA